MTRKTTARLWIAVAAAAALLIVAAMVVLTLTARRVSGYLRDGVLAEVPPVTAASMGQAMDGIPRAPFLALDEELTNAVTTRMVVNLVAQQGARGAVLVFRSDRPHKAVVEWYRKNLPGWDLTRPETRRNRDHSSAEVVVFRYQDRRMMLMALPQFRGRVVMVITQRPKNKGAPSPRPG